jgi:MFS transporter, DHA1 family, multidrug resistance protein
VTSALQQPAVAAPTSRERLRLVLLLGALIALGPLTIDMYLPALPTITDEFATTSATVQLTLTGTLLGLALGQLVVGPFSDAVGRRVPLLVGTGVHLLASLMSVAAPNVAVLGGLRVLQGLGAAAGAVIAMAIVRDLYTGRAAATLLSRLILVMGAAPVIAPTLGGWLLTFTSWRGVFAALALYAALLIPLAARWLPETLPAQYRQTSGVLGTLRNYRGLLRDGTFVGLILVAGLAMSALLAYVAGSSFVFQEEFGLTQQQFGLVFGSGAIWLILATQLNPVLLRRYEPRQILLGAVSAAAAFGLLLLGIAVGTDSGLLGVLVPVWLVLFSIGFAAQRARGGPGPARRDGRHGGRAARRRPVRDRGADLPGGRRARQRQRGDGHRHRRRVAAVAAGVAGRRAAVAAGRPGAGGGAGRLISPPAGSAP